MTVSNGGRFKVGDQVRPDGAREVLFVTGVAGNVLTVVRRYGSTSASNLSNGQKLFILGNAALVKVLVYGGNQMFAAHGGLGWIRR